MKNRHCMLRMATAILSPRSGVSIVDGFCTSRQQRVDSFSKGKTSALRIFAFEYDFPSCHSILEWLRFWELLALLPIWLLDSRGIIDCTTLPKQMGINPFSHKMQTKANNKPSHLLSVLLWWKSTPWWKWECHTGENPHQQSRSRLGQLISLITKFLGNGIKSLAKCSSAPCKANGIFTDLKLVFWVDQRKGSASMRVLVLTALGNASFSSFSIVTPKASECWSLCSFSKTLWIMKSCSL